jgi:hypothetical protein
LGYYLLQSYDLEKAAECFNDVAKIFPESFEAWTNLGMLVTGCILSRASWGETGGAERGYLPSLCALRKCVIEDEQRSARWLAIVSR